jgi:hypothetical protein
MIKSVAAAAAAQDKELGEVLRMHLEMEGEEEEEEEEEEPRGAGREETNTEEETCCCWVVIRLKDSAPNPLLVMLLSLLLQQQKPCPNIARTDSHPQRKKTEKRKKYLSKTSNYDSS